MSTELPEPYIVRPDLERGGFILTGPRIPFPLRYLCESAAAGYAHHHGRVAGGKVLVLGRNGDALFSERIEYLKAALH